MKADLTIAINRLKLGVTLRMDDRKTYAPCSEGRAECHSRIRSYIAAIRILEMANGTRIVKGGGK